MTHQDNDARFKNGDSGDETDYDATQHPKGIRRAIGELNDYALGRSDEFPEPS